MYVITTFLNGLICDKVHIEMEEGFPDANTLGKVYKVNWALYCLRQSLKAWYELIDI